MTKGYHSQNCSWEVNYHFYQDLQEVSWLWWKPNEVDSNWPNMGLGVDQWIKHLMHLSVCWHGQWGKHFLKYFFIYFLFLFFIVKVEIFPKFCTYIQVYFENQKSTFTFKINCKIVKICNTISSKFGAV